MDQVVFQLMDERQEHRGEGNADKPGDDARHVRPAAGDRAGDGARHDQRADQVLVTQPAMPLPQSVRCGADARPNALDAMFVGVRQIAGMHGYRSPRISVVSIRARPGRDRAESANRMTACANVLLVGHR